MATTANSRTIARAAQIELIKDTARRLLAEKGAEGLSLREVAREMNLVSSALYRYFATRDELLTALILDAYNDLGRRVERADARVERDDWYGRWVAGARTLRRWAKSHPHEYALIYGTPIVHYVAPPETVVAAARVPIVLGRVLSDHAQLGSTASARASALGVGDVLDAEALAAIMPEVDPKHFAQALMAWTLLYGYVSFELFGHFVGTVTNANLLYDRVLDELAASFGITPVHQ